MITKVTTYNFKRFEMQTFQLEELTLLAGPNNSGKSTLMQAVMVWNLALQRWNEKKGPKSGSKASERSGAPITRPEFTALPLPSMDQLWTDTHTSLRKGEVEGKAAGSKKSIVIILEGVDRHGEEWALGMELVYSGPEQIHVKPVEVHLGDVSRALEDVSVVYIPPFSGIGINETRYDRPYQDMLVGQGKGGDILRNLLLDVAERDDPADWDRMETIVERIFQYRLLKPRYGGQPYIGCEYLKGIPPKKGLGGLPPLDVSTAGSGFHQVLLILAFLFGRPSSLILLDEPDAHLHVLLQRELYDIIRALCQERDCQLVIATHSEILIDNTAPEQILSFYRTKPHILEKKTHRDEIREALKRVTALELLQADQAKGVLYLEGTTDFSLLRAWAQVLDHSLTKWFEDQPFWHDNRGCTPKEANAHFFALRAIRNNLQGVLLLDGDNRNLPESELSAKGIDIIRWERYEAESYLLHPEALYRFIENESEPLFVKPALDVLRDDLPASFFKEPLKINATLRSEPASKTLLPKLLEKAGISLSKNEYYLIARQMKPAELPDEVGEKLDAIAAIVLPAGSTS